MKNKEQLGIPLVQFWALVLFLVKKKKVPQCFRVSLVKRKRKKIAVLLNLFSEESILLLNLTLLLQQKISLRP